MEMGSEKKYILHEAFSCSFLESFEVIQSMLQHGASVSERNNNGQTPLHVVVTKEMSVKLARELLKYGADIDVQDNDGNTPLHIAILFNKPDVIRLLLKHGAPINIKNKYGEHPLHTAILKNSAMNVIEDLLKAGADANAQDINGNSPLHEAIRSCASDFSVVEKLVKYGASVNSRNNLNETPLHLSITYDVGLKGVQRLLKLGAEVNARDNNGDSPLYLAIRKKSIDIIKKLLQNGPRNISEFWRDISLDFSLNYGINPRGVHNILNSEVNINAKNKKGNTVLHEAIRYCSSEIDVIKRLLEKGAAVNTINHMGENPLHYCLKYGLGMEIIKQLFGDTNDEELIRDVMGKSIFHIVRCYTILNFNAMKERPKYRSLGSDRKKYDKTPLHFIITTQTGMDLIQYLYDFEQGALYIPRENSTDNILADLEFFVDKSIELHGISFSKRVPKRILEGDPFKSSQELLQYSLIEHKYNNEGCRLCDILCDKFGDFGLQCKNEISKMYEDVVLSKITVVDFVMHRYDYSKLVSADKDILPNLLLKYPLYSDIIYERLTNRHYLVRKLKEVQAVMEINGVKVNINSYCLYPIGQYLSTDDLKNFVRALLNI